MAADIHIITIEIVHKSNLCARGTRCPFERFAVFPNIFALHGQS